MPETLTSASVPASNPIALRLMRPRTGNDIVANTASLAMSLTNSIASSAVYPANAFRNVRKGQFARDKTAIGS